MAHKISRKRLFTEIRRMDPKLSEDDPSFIEAAVLLDSSIVGPNADTIAEHLALPRRKVREIGARARKSGLWVGETVAHSGWFDKEDGGMAFWLDVCVLRGLMTRT